MYIVCTYGTLYVFSLHRIPQHVLHKTRRCQAYLHVAGAVAVSTQAVLVTSSNRAKIEVSLFSLEVSCPVTGAVAIHRRNVEVQRGEKLAFSGDVLPRDGCGCYTEQWQYRE